MPNAGKTKVWKTIVGKTNVGKSIATKLDHTPNVEKKNVR